MSSYLDFYIEVYNEDVDKWEDVSLYKIDNETGNYVPVTLGGFSRSTPTYQAIAAPCDMMGYTRGLPENISCGVANKILAENGGYYYSNATWFDYIELSLLAKTKAAKYYDDDKHKKVNAIKPLLAQVEMLLNTYGIYYTTPGKIRIICITD